MAQKVQTLFVDDIDGSDAEGTVRFGLDGTDYDIDLNEEHAQALRNAVREHLESTPAERVHLFLAGPGGLALGHRFLSWQSGQHRPYRRFDHGESLV